MHRQGIGRGLVTALLDATAESRFAVATGRENKPARALYESLGFMHVRDEEIVDRLWLARYRLDR
ncbi:MAG: ribosomal protein S18 acetylase RimI-like enzyme [Rhodococcus sp. (in: high G+C Gram-positive bacteria)]|jgi:ribosomal protein S18 acetylase RimI-like enzyme|nr:GNAT family N-acetyltransferase [Rhodococcus sp. I2R]